MYNQLELKVLTRCSILVKIFFLVSQIKFNINFHEVVKLDWMVFVFLCKVLYVICAIAGAVFNSAKERTQAIPSDPLTSGALDKVSFLDGW